MSESRERREVRRLLDLVEYDETSPWEDDFLGSIEDKLNDPSWEPTPLQLAKLAEIAARW